MKKLLLLLFSILISLNSYGEWLLLGEDSGNKFYYEVDTIKTSNGYIYFWDLVNFSEPFAGIYMSGLRYKQGDCGVFRDKTLSGFLFFFSHRIGFFPSSHRLIIIIVLPLSHPMPL